MQNYLLCDEDIGGRKSAKAKELGFVFMFFYDLLYFMLAIFPCFPNIHIFVNIFNWIASYSTKFLTEDGLFDMIHASNKSKTSIQESKKPLDKVAPSPPKKSPQVPETKSMCSLNYFVGVCAHFFKCIVFIMLLL